ncbi:DUF1501 domain-containing protein [Nakamurella sp. PAMC28650]|uniref:DUF1501 domain-containing protein n=1 Tax=Nakamurella sp. PAMC28650 TaxID=2762325 RepID=UPI00164D9DD2|nr:DUF1501 domain-containing protein [Nakamurella sp. PAMC28650]QNK79790.1 DUF1501 domain-containing protein [Nakamurella sp. PAMC28650]
MNIVTRRRFLVASGTAGVAAAAVAAGYVSWPELQRKAAANPLAGGTPILVIVTLYGGNDGLGAVIPYADPAYLKARPDFAYTAAEVHQLGDGLGLNPAMKGMAALWSNQQLAIVRGVGYPQPDHSHFRSMDIWQTASPSAPINTGWIGRWLDLSGDDPTRAVNIGSVLPPLAVGAKGAAAALPLGRSTRLPAALGAAFTGLGKTDSADTPFQAMVAASYCSERKVDATFSPVLAGAADVTPADEATPAGTAGGQQGLGAQFDMVARCIKAGVPTTVYTVSLGGFDTHADEKGTQQTQLGTLDTALSGFLASMAADPRGKDVVVMAYSEFGRRVGANASHGTDHGTAGPMFVAGLPVKGGFYGEQPSLTDLDDADLKSNVDFRTVYGELLSKVVRTDPQPIVGSTAAPLGFLA